MHPVRRRSAIQRIAGASARLGAVLLAAFPIHAAEFGSDVQPLLSDRCFSCHGPDAAQRQAGLRLDLRDAAIAEAASGRVPIRPGDPDASELLRRVEADDPAVRMPPAYLGHEPLDPAEVAVLRRWILDGAEYESHWAFSPPARPTDPAVADASWPARPLDAFVLARLENEGFEPSAAASPAAWLRRMMLDLNGLPPTLAELGAFHDDVARRGDAAYEAAADRALASPRFGERMAMDWLDVARYADTHGFNNDSERSMWRWRDWVIGAFNRNLPYRDFIVEQLAGDLLPAPTLDQRIATGFNRNHVINSEGGIIEEEYRVEYVADRVRTLGMAWLGLTIECARCHDHKFDPVSQEDYYRFFAFFDNQPEHGEAGRVANAVPMIRAPTTEQSDRLAHLRSREARLALAREERMSAWAPRSEALEKLVAPERLDDTAFALGCNEPEGNPSGAVGRSCGVQEVEPEEPLKLEKHGAFTLSVWLRPASATADAPLFSAIDYEPDPASSNHGDGIELRMAGEEVEIRLSKRYPSYSITVRTDGAGLQPAQWRHVAVLYEGSEGKQSMRARAAWVRLFVDGREVATRTLHDDLHNAAKFKAPYRLGSDNSREGRTFDGAVDELSVWTRALSETEILQVFESAALPLALRRPQSPVERAWLYRKLQPDPKLDRVRRRLFALERSLPTAMVMQEMPVRRQTRLLVRGRYDSPGDPVDPGVPETLLGAWPEGALANRLGLAEWLTRPDHPTTARVVVNRFWQQLFGSGLVKTAADFGLQGEPPSHPGLLDRMALDFVDSGWDVKGLLRRIVLSSTYRQASAVGGAGWSRDPENRLLGRGPRVRLAAEAIRDQALAMAGLLSGRVGGPSVRPYQPEGLYDGVVVGAEYPGTTWEQDAGESLYRRSLYTFWKRTLPHPAMTVFDAPDREFCTVQRSRTNTPLQALTLLNDPTFVEAARKLAERSIREAGPDPGSRIRYLFATAAGRSPDAEESRILLESLERFAKSYRDDDAAARALTAVGESQGDERIASDELAAYAAIASLILNLDEVITKG